MSAMQSLPAPMGDFRRTYGIPEDRFLVLLATASSGPSDLPSLLTALGDVPEEWELVVVRDWEDTPEKEAGIEDQLSYIPGTLLLRGPAPELLSAAIAAADVVVPLPVEEGALECRSAAMALGRPWLIAPADGASHERTGGITCGLEQFKAYLEALSADGEARRRLGELGQAYWQAQHSGKTAGTAKLDKEAEELADRLRRQLYLDIPAYQQMRKTGRRGELPLRFGRLTAPKPPLVSVILSSKMEASSLNEAIESLVAQTFKDWELVILNCDNSEETAQAASRVATFHPDVNLRILTQAGVDSAEAFRAGVRLARGSFILPMEAGDELAPDLLQEAVLALGVQSDVSGPLFHRGHWEDGGSAADITVVIPCYKQAVYLSEAVASVVAQTYNGWQIVIVNDGSPDQTSQVARRLITDHPGKIVLVEQGNGGLACARNTGIRMADGPYYLPLDADDQIRPSMMERTRAILDARTDIGFAYTEIQHFGVRDDVFRLPDFDSRTLVFRDNIVCVNSLVRKEVWTQCGGYDEAMREGYEDWDYWVTCVEKGWDGYCIHEPLFCYRKTGQSMLSDANQKRERLIATIVLNHPRLYDVQTLGWAEGILRQEIESSATASRRTPAAVNAGIPDGTCARRDKERPVIKSFDVFDTLIARRCLEPRRIHEHVEMAFGIRGFARLRREAEIAVSVHDYGLDDIYRALGQSQGWDSSLLDSLKQAEINTELEQVIPIAENLALVRDGDLLVSDMYLGEEIIRRLLEKAGMDRNVGLYVSSHGKASGQVWPKVLEKFQVSSHMGDSMDTDVRSPRAHGITTTHTAIASPTPVEAWLMQAGLRDIALICREARLALRSPDHLSTELQSLQTSVNFPMLLLASIPLARLVQEKAIKHVLFGSRDGELWMHLFRRFAKNIGLECQIEYFYTSRVARRNPSADYFAYADARISERSVIVDICGTGWSLAHLVQTLDIDHCPVFFLVKLSKYDVYETVAPTPSVCDVAWVLNQDSEQGKGSWASLEWLNAAPYGSVTDVRRVGDTVVPVLDEDRRSPSAVAFVRRQVEAFHATLAVMDRYNLRDLMVLNDKTARSLAGRLAQHARVQGILQTLYLKEAIEEDLDIYRRLGCNRGG